MVHEELLGQGFCKAAVTRAAQKGTVLTSFLNFAVSACYPLMLEWEPASESSSSAGLSLLLPLSLFWESGEVLVNDFPR